MIEPPSAAPPRIGRLAPPSEEELAAACDKLRDEAVTVPWAAERLGIGVARVEALMRSGDLLAIPGPWPMRQAHRSGLGYFLPAWQLDPDERRPRPELTAVLEAAADRGWTSLDLHRFMTAPAGPDGSSPAGWLRAGDAERVVALIRGEPRSVAAAPAPTGRLGRLRAVRRPRPRRRPITA